ncbi:hypothetical protein [Pedobacter sp. WC2423]|uniref:hypothetical protein n=1 Tax=Pedobacter sp. WC2423 TaxID=3234142 RepID=UPI00346713B9
MKRTIVLSILSCAISTVFAQTQPALPFGSIPYSNQQWLSPDGSVWTGTPGRQYRNLGTKAKMDSLLNLKAIDANVVHNTGSEVINGRKEFMSPSSVGGVFNDRPNVDDPPHAFNIVNDAGNNFSYLFQGTAYSNSTGLANFHIRKARGTFANPLAVLNGDVLASFGFRGFDGVNFAASSVAIQAIARQNFTSTANGTSLLFQTTPLGNYLAHRVDALELLPNGDAKFYNMITAGGIGNNAIRMIGTAPFMSWYDITNTTRWGYMAHNGSALVISNDLGGGVAINNPLTITGKITFSGAPTNPNDGANKIYVDSKVLTGSKILDFGSISPGGVAELTIDVPGAIPGDVAVFGGSGLPLQFIFQCYVSSSNVVKISLFNTSTNGTFDPSPTLFKIKVFKD